MAPQIIWRYFKKRHKNSAANTLKQDRSFSNSESMAAANYHPMQKLEKEEVALNRAQLQEEEDQGKLQLQKEEEQDKVQLQEEEEQGKVQLQEEEEQGKVQLQEDEEQGKVQLQEEQQGKFQFKDNMVRQNNNKGKSKSKTAHARSRRLIKKVVKSGFRGGSGSYPFMKRIQASFGRYNISNVQSFNDAAAKHANQKLGALAYASGNKVAFRGYPDLHTSAHEAAHIIQQRKGIELHDGSGNKREIYERHADAVANRVVHGKSAENLLGTVP